MRTHDVIDTQLRILRAQLDVVGDEHYALLSECVFAFDRKKTPTEEQFKRLAGLGGELRKLNERLDTLKWVLGYDVPPPARGRVAAPVAPTDGERLSAATSAEGHHVE